jgi:hypothetical protein
MRLELKGKIWARTSPPNGEMQHIKCRRGIHPAVYLAQKKLPELIQQMNTKSSYFQFNLRI